MFLVVLLLELDGHGGVLEFPPGIVVIAVEVERLGNLFGNRARTLSQAEVNEVVGKSSQHADHIDPLVLVEALVFGRHYRLTKALAR